MRKSTNISQGKTSIATTTMLVKDPKGNKEKRTMRVYKKSYPSNTKSLTQFLEPASIRGSSYMFYDWNAEGKEDDSWFYLPSLRKSKRITGSDKSKPFMGSDFTYSDISGMEVGDWDYSYVDKKVIIDGKPCYHIEATPKKERRAKVLQQTGYKKTHVWVRHDNYVPVQGKYWLIDGRKIKFMKASNIRKVNGIWTSYDTQMVTTLGGTKELSSTLNTIVNIKFNNKISDNKFSQKSMESGI
jgi:outer membrane lipoprotein-sorting protein